MRDASVRCQIIQDQKVLQESLTFALHLWFAFIGNPIRRCQIYMKLYTALLKSA